MPDAGRLFSTLLLDIVNRTVPVPVLRIKSGSCFPVAMLLVCFLAGAVHAADDPRAAHTEKLELLRERISELKKELVSMRGQRDAMQEALENAEKEIGVVTATLRGLDNEADQARRSMQDLQRKFDAEQKNLERTRVILERELQIAYMAGKQEQIKLLLNQEDPAALARLMVFHQYFMRARTRAMHDIRATLERLAGIEQKQALKREEIQGLIGQQQKKSSQLLVQQDKRREVLALLQDRLSSKTDQLVALEEDEQRLQKLVQSLQQAIRDIPLVADEYASLPSLKGKLGWPVAGYMTMYYGEQHAYGKLRSRGVHIASTPGADVHVIARGRVVFADWLRGFGLLLIVDHGDNYMSLYGQNSSLYKEVGEWVARDEVVAAAGSSGGRVQAGLYLELRKDGRPIDPGGWFHGTPRALTAADRASH